MFFKSSSNFGINYLFFICGLGVVVCTNDLTSLEENFCKGKGAIKNEIKSKATFLFLIS